jgi:hypothetical protein
MFMDDPYIDNGAKLLSYKDDKWLVNEEIHGHKRGFLGEARAKHPRGSAQHRLGTVPRSHLHINDSLVDDTLQTTVIVLHHA